MKNDEQKTAQACADAMWAGDRASQDLGMAIVETGPGTATISMPVTENMLNGLKTCHGGYIFTLADSAFAFACNSQNQIAVAAGARIEFIAPARLGDTLVAKARAVTQGKRSGVYDITVSNQSGKTVALFRGNSARIGGSLVDEVTGEPLSH